MSAPPGKKRKITHALENPHKDAEIPDLKLEDQQVVLEMLCSFLEPVGTYRAQHIQPSEGKRKKKRQKRALKKAQTTDPGTNAPVDRPPLPPPPDTSNHVLVGFNVLNRHLETLAAFTAPTDPKPKTLKAHAKSQKIPTVPPPIAAIFYPARDVSPLLTHHLPLLCHLASFNQPSHPPTRLIPLSLPRASEKLSKSLHLPQVSFVGVVDDSSTSTNALIEYCREKARPVKLPWLDGLKQGQYEAVKVRKNETFEGPSKKQKAKERAKNKAETGGGGEQNES